MTDHPRDEDTRTTETRPEGDLAPGSPHGEGGEEPLGPITPDEETELGDTPEVHDGIAPHDLPKDHPGRAEAERQAQEADDGLAEGNV
jgi:hypothetical protein